MPIRLALDAKDPLYNLRFEVDVDADTRILSLEPQQIEPNTTSTKKERLEDKHSIKSQDKARTFPTHPCGLRFRALPHGCGVYQSTLPHTVLNGPESGILYSSGNSPSDPTGTYRNCMFGIAGPLSKWVQEIVPKCTWRNTVVACVCFNTCDQRYP